MVFWGVDVVEGFRMHRNPCFLLCFMTVLDTTWKPLRETFGYLFSLHFGRTLLLAVRAGSRPNDFKSGCFAWEGLSRFTTVVVSRRRNERWRFQASAQIRRPQNKTSFRVDETQYFPGSTIRSSLPRARREARHKPGWRFSLVFWGVDVVE